MPEAQDDAAEAGGREQAELMVEKGLAGDLDKHFGNALGDGPQAGRESSGEERDG
jgi:hypothetical protein